MKTLRRKRRLRKSKKRGGALMNNSFSTEVSIPIKNTSSTSAAINKSYKDPLMGHNLYNNNNHSFPVATMNPLMKYKNNPYTSPSIDGFSITKKKLIEEHNEIPIIDGIPFIYENKSKKVYICPNGMDVAVPYKYVFDDKYEDKAKMNALSPNLSQLHKKFVRLDMDLRINNILSNKPLGFEDAFPFVWNPPFDTIKMYEYTKKNIFGIQGNRQKPLPEQTLSYYVGISERPVVNAMKHKHYNGY